MSIPGAHRNRAEALPPRPPAGRPTLKVAVPILLVRNVEASAEFFRRTLGFEIDFLHGAPPFYGSVSRDGVCLHLRFVHEPVFPLAAAKEESLICVSIETDDVQRLYDEFRARHAPFAQTPVKQTWGGTDFHVRDPDGNVISFVTYG
jgi:catechol 2,3-dioxygenase-like lactoylglutathione lyase family enzyme